MPKPYQFLRPLVWFLFLFFSVQTLQAAYSVNTLVSAGNNLLTHDRYWEAEICYFQAYQQDVRNPVIIYGLGLCEYGLQHWEPAKAFFQQSLALSPLYAGPKTMLDRVTTILLKQQQMKDYQQQWLLYGKKLFHLRQYDQALAAFLQAEKLDDKSLDAHFNLGITYLKLKDWQYAYQEMQTCLTLDPQNAEAHYALASLYKQTGNNQLAQDNYAWITQFAPSGPTGIQAQQQLSQLAFYAHPSPNGTAFSSYTRVVAGYDFTESTGTPSDYPMQYLQESFSYNPPWFNKFFSFSAALGGSLDEPDSGSSGSYYGDLTASIRPQLSKEWYLPVSLDEMGEFASFFLTEYEHHQASLGVQYLFAQPDFIQVQFQALQENYPTFTDYDSTSFAGSVSAWHYFPGGHGLGLAYSYRNTSAQNTFYNYSYNTVGLNYYYGGKDLTITAVYSSQWQNYPNFLDTNGNPRNDWTQSATAEFSIPLNSMFGLGIGNQFSYDISTYTYYSGWSNFVYLFTSVRL